MKRDEIGVAPITINYINSYIKFCILSIILAKTYIPPRSQMRETSKSEMDELLWS